MSKSMYVCSFGLMPASPINIPTALLPNQSTSYSLQLSAMGPVQRMDPLSNLQVLHCGTLGIKILN